MKKYRTALLFGTFNPLHSGHIRLFKRATKIADKVYIVMDDDNLIIKSKRRNPFGSRKERQEDIEMIKGIIFAGFESIKEDKKYWVDIIKPDVLIKGDDWKGNNWSGEKLGIPVKYLKHTNNIHSKWLGNI